MGIKNLMPKPPAEWGDIPAKIDPLTGQDLVYAKQVAQAFDVPVDFEEATDLELTQAEAAASKLKAIENALKIKQYQAMIDEMQKKNRSDSRTGCSEASPG